MEELKTWQKLLQISNSIDNVVSSLRIARVSQDNTEMIQDCIARLLRLEKQLNALSNDERP